MDTNNSKMQKLHQLAVQGEILTIEEQTKLQNWYETLDHEEDLILNNSQPIQNNSELRKNLTQVTKQVAKVSREIGILVKQNENLRKENQALIQAFELRLLEKVV